MSKRMSRRDLLRTGTAAAGAAGFQPRFAASAQEAAVAPGTAVPPPLNRFSRMVQEHFVEQVRSAERSIIAKQAGLKTRQDAEAYVASVQARIGRCFGPLPPKTPLRPRVTGTVERDTYRIEKVIFESRPEFLVTANLYLPKGYDYALPGVVGSCGHSDNGKASEPYQSFAQGLARLGYVVLIFDPIGQGERIQYTDANLKPRRGIGVSEHLHAGNQQFLVGESLATWRAWDGVRALDYLLTRKEVDPRHVGITGNSGDGTMTTWLCGIESRWSMAAPGCFVTTFRRNMENELPADTEQCPPSALALGLDHSDFVAAMAPKPVIILAKERDYFDVRGATEAYERLKRLYTVLGKPDNIALQIGPTEHGYTRENREAMYRWFDRATGRNREVSEPALEIEKDETLQCTPDGQVAGLKSRTLFDFTQAKSGELAARRGSPSGDELRRLVTEALKLPVRPQSAPDYRILRPLSGRGYPRPHATTYAVETEPGVFAVVTRPGDRPHYSRPPQGPERAFLYVSHHSADAELRTEPRLRRLLEEPSAALYACDVRGIGESRPDTCGADQFTKPYGSDYFYAAHSLMLDRPYAGQRTHDLLRVFDWLQSAGHARIHVLAKGWGTVPALFAALLDARVDELTLIHGLESYASISESEDYDWPLSAFLPGVLEKFDLTDCYRELRRTRTVIAERENGRRV